MLNDLSSVGLIHLNPVNLHIMAAVPFSSHLTRHKVRLGSGQEVYALCAIDALGIFHMTGQDAVIMTTDPEMDTLIRVARIGGRWCWKPETVCVSYTGACNCKAFKGKQPASGTAGPDPSWIDHCTQINFYASKRSAKEQFRKLGIAGRVMIKSQAIAAGEVNFGQILN